MSPVRHPSPAAVQASLRPLALQRLSAVQVSHAFLVGRVNVLPPFGPPTVKIVPDPRQRVAMSMPCRICRRAVRGCCDHAEALRQLRIPHALAPLDDAHRVVGVQPGTRLSLHGDGPGGPRVLLAAMHASGARGDDRRAAAATHGHTVGAWLAAWQPSPVAMAQRHAAHLEQEALR